MKVEDHQIRHQDKTSSSTSTSPKWTTKSSDPAKDRSSRAASEAAEVETAGQTASSENCYNHYARNLLLVHKWVVYFYLERYQDLVVVARVLQLHLVEAAGGEGVIQEKGHQGCLLRTPSRSSWFMEAKEAVNTRGKSLIYAIEIIRKFLSFYSTCLLTLITSS